MCNHIHASTEAKDKIMKIIDEYEKRGNRLKLIVSVDSNFFRSIFVARSTSRL